MISRNDRITLIKDQKTDYSIIICQNPSKCERFAANELQLFIQRVSGCKIPILQCDDRIISPSIILGFHPFYNYNKFQINLKDLGEEGFILFTEGQNIFIIGSNLRGILYGVYTFLEKYLEIKFLWPQISKIPKNNSIYIPNLNLKMIPSFTYRFILHPKALDADYSSKTKINVNPFLLPKHGTNLGLSIKHMNNTFYDLVSPEKYFDNNPELFALVDGKRVNKDGQLCLTNPDTIKISIESVFNWMEEEKNSKIFGIIPMDWLGYCECENCQRINAEEGSTSGSLIYFVNQIAKKVAEKNPQIILLTNAYTITEKPPKNLKPLDNVFIVACNQTPICSVHSIEACQFNSRFKENLENWIKLTPNVLVWYYIVNYKHLIMPFPNILAIPQNLTYFKKIGIKGVIFQMELKPGAISEFEELKCYLVSKLLWDTEENWKNIVDIFINEYYGQGSSAIKEYFYTLQNFANNSNVHLHHYSNNFECFLSEEFLIKSIKLFNSAIAATSLDSFYLNNVKKTKLSIDYAFFIQQIEWKTYGELLIPSNFEQRLKMLNEFKSTIENNKIKSINEDFFVDTFIKKQETLTQRHSILALWEIAPIALSLLREVIKICEKFEQDGILNILKLTEPLTQLGLEHNEIKDWFMLKKLHSISEKYLWQRKVLKDNLVNFLNPKIPELEKDTFDHIKKIDIWQNSVFGL